MSALLGQAAILDHMDFVYIDYRAESVGAVYHCLAFHDLLELRHYALLRVGVQVARRLIEQENIGVGLEQSTGNQDSLSLSA